MAFYDSNSLTTISFGGYGLRECTCIFLYSNTVTVTYRAVYAIGDYAFFGAYSLTTLNFDWYECNEGVE